MDRSIRTIARRSLLVGAAGLVYLVRAETNAQNAPPSVRVAIAQGAAPIAFAAPDGEMVGMIVDALRAVTAAPGWTLHFLGLPWARAQQWVREGLADAHVTLPTEDRRRYLRFAKAPLFTLNSAVMHFSPRNPMAQQIRDAGSLDDLRAFRIAVLLGDSWPQNLMRGWANLHETKDDPTTLLMVRSGRADIAFCSRQVFRHYARTIGVEDLESREVDFVPGGIGDFTFALRADFPEVEARLAEFEGYQQAMIDGGALARVLDKYA